MTLGNLREFITTNTDMEDDALVLLTPSVDHSYRLADFEIEEVEKNGREYFEYFNDANLSPKGKKVRAFVIG